MIPKAKLPSGFKENEQEINRLKFQIEDAISCRNYTLAAQHQKALNERLERRRQILASQQKSSRVADILNLRHQQKIEEEELKSEMRERARQILDAAKERLHAMEATHQKQIEALDTRFSDQSFIQLRTTSDYYISRRAEEYYSHTGEYAVAAAIKDELSDKTLKTMENNELEANKIVNAHIETAIYKQEKQKRGFKVHLENEKNRLVKEAMVVMNRIANKYAKLRQQIVGSPKADAEYQLQKKLRDEKTGIMKMLDDIFAEFENNVQLMGMEPNPLVTDKMPQSARYTFKPRSPRLETAQFSTIRNPRVVKALERSLMKRELAVVNSAEPLSNILPN